MYVIGIMIFNKKTHQYECIIMSTLQYYVSNLKIQIVKQRNKNLRKTLSLL